MELTPESAWDQCLEIIRDNVPRQSFKTWFEPLKPLRLEEEDGVRKLTVQLPSQFYYEWLEEHYFALVRKTVTKVLGPQGRLFYDIVIEKESTDGYEGASMRVTASGSSVDVDSGPTAGAARVVTSSAAPGDTAVGGVHPFVIPGMRKAQVDSQGSPAYAFDRFSGGDCSRLAGSATRAFAPQP